MFAAKAMFFTSPAEPRARAIWRWGGAIALLLAVQSVLLAGLFWALASGSHRRSVEQEFAKDCRAFVSMPAPERPMAVRAMLTRDIHRDRFLGLFDASGLLIDGNVAAIPANVSPGARSMISPVRPTELPGKHSDVARLAVCMMPDGTQLLTGVDLDDAEDALRVVEHSLLIGLIPGLILATTFGLAAGRRAARQVDAVRGLTQRIVSGELDQRLPVSAAPDSFGLLCAHINMMLDRIQLLVADVRGVGDDIAHQLRTPVTRLRARIERGLRTATDRVAFEAVAEDALGEIDKLLALVAALLRTRELEDQARRSRFAPVDLTQIVEDACELYRPTAEDRGIDLHCVIDPVPFVEGDASLLIEALSNLIDNAIKFGPPGGRVGVSLSRSDTCAIMTVTDEGAGVPLTERTLVTQRFYRGRHEHDGAGLGLSIVKAIVDLHGFSLSFAGQGSAVSVTCEPFVSEALTRVHS